MRVVELSGQFGVTHLRLVERPVPAPGPGEVAIKVRAVSLNYRDLLMIRGEYNPRQPLPLIPASDGVGEVVAVGEGVERVALGDRVCPLFAEGWLSGPPLPHTTRHTRGGPLDGMLAEVVVVPAHSVVIPPAHLTDAEAACLPCAMLTAWSALVTLGGLKASDTVLIQGTGGVALSALVLAKALGATVIMTSSSNEKLARVAAMGADHGINYRENPRWGDAARAITGKRGVDLVIEVGGAETLAQSLRAVRPGGTISLIGVLSGGLSQLRLESILMRQVRVQGVFVGNRDGFEAMNGMVGGEGIRPVVDSRFAFTEVAEALAHMEAGAHFGKVVVVV
ncbi:MAG: NADPH:quinone reductase-like Zn-dependent oxidoreductase [Myxococcota bacterium]|jgi:NADPH:quinone reductase-like Zn-dependent oxidoreductase